MQFQISPQVGLDYGYIWISLNNPKVERVENAEGDIMESDEALVPCLGFELIKFKPKGSPATQDVEQIFPEIE